MDDSRECPVNVTYNVLNFTTRESPSFFGTFTKLRKANISFVMSVRLSVCPSVLPSVRMENLGSHWTNFYKIVYISIIRNSVEKNQS